MDIYQLGEFGLIEEIKKKFPCKEKSSLLGIGAVSYTHLTLPTNREV